MNTCGTRLGLLLTCWLAFGAMDLAADPVCDLSRAEDQVLQQQLEKLLAEQGLSHAVERGDLALSLLILTDPGKPRLAQVNGHHMMYAASLPKIAILLGAAVAIDQGRLKPDDALLDDIHSMIRVSCNDCANRVIERVGEDELLATLQSPRFMFYDSEDGGLWLGKQYGRNPAWERDPLHDLSHGASTFQVTRFYCALQRGTLVSPRQNQMMLDALSIPGIDHKFVAGLEPYENIQMFRKSGSWRAFHADSALVRKGKSAYVIVGLAHDENGGAWLEQVAAPLHELALP